MRYMKVKIFIITVLILISGIVFTTSSRVSAEREEQQLSAEDQKLLQVAATREGVDASRLKLLKSSTVELPLTGRRVQTAKVLNSDNGQTLTASIDEQEQEVDFPSLQAEEKRVFRARYGKLHPKLQQKIAGFGDEQSIKDPRIHRVAVAFWVNPTEDLEAQDPRDGRTDLNREEVDALLARRMDQVKAATSRATEGLTRALEQAGHTVDRRDEGAPVVFATLPAGLVKQFAERAEPATTVFVLQRGM